jgi:O-antigen/teichoic acid export membrane protein
MRKQLVRDGTIYAGATIASSAGPIVLVPLYARLLPPAQYGVVDFLSAVQVLFQIAIGLELTQGIARLYSEAESGDARRAFASTGFWYLVTAYSVGGILLALAARPLSATLLGDAAYTHVVRVALLWMVLRVLFYALQAQLRWELRPWRYAVASVVTVGISIAFSTYLLVVIELGLVGVFWGLAGGYAAGCAVCLVSLRHTYTFTFDGECFRAMLRFSAPLTGSSLAVFAAAYCDRFIVRALLGLDDLGVYGVAARIAAVIAVATGGFQLGTAPLVYRRFREADTPQALSQLLRWFLATGLLFVLVLTAFAPEIVALVASADYAAAADVMPLLALAAVCASLYIFVPGLTIHQLTGRLAAINAAVALTSVGATVVLARAFGVTGAAMATLAGAVLGFALNALFSQRVYPLPIAWLRIVGALACALAAMACAGWLRDSGPPSAIARMLLLGSSVVAISVLLLPTDSLTLRRYLPSVGAR